MITVTINIQGDENKEYSWGVRHLPSMCCFRFKSLLGKALSVCVWECNEWNTKEQGYLISWFLGFFFFWWQNTEHTFLLNTGVNKASAGSCRNRFICMYAYKTEQNRSWCSVTVVSKWEGMSTNNKTHGYREWSRTHLLTERQIRSTRGGNTICYFGDE